MLPESVQQLQCPNTLVRWANVAVVRQSFHIMPESTCVRHTSSLDGDPFQSGLSCHKACLTHRVAEVGIDSESDWKGPNYVMSPSPLGQGIIQSIIQSICVCSMSVISELESHRQ